MTALEFPTNPTNGQVFDNWTWDGTKWNLTPVAGGGGGLSPGVTTFNAENVTGIAATETNIPLTQSGPDLVTGREYLVVLMFPVRFGTGVAGATVLSYLKHDGANIAITQWYGDTISNERWTDTVTNRWVCPDGAAPVTLTASTSASSLQTNYVASTRATAATFIPVDLLAPGGGGGGSDGYTFVQDTLPVATAGGQTWFDTSTGNTFTWYIDTGVGGLPEGQWVMDGPGGGGEREPLLSVRRLPTDRGENLATDPIGGFDLCRGRRALPQTWVSTTAWTVGALPGDVSNPGLRRPSSRWTSQRSGGSPGSPTSSRLRHLLVLACSPDRSGVPEHISPSAVWETSAATIGWFVPAGQEWTYKARIIGGTFNGGNCNFGNVSRTHTIVPA